MTAHKGKVPVILNIEISHQPSVYYLYACLLHTKQCTKIKIKYVKSSPLLYTIFCFFLFQATNFYPKYSFLKNTNFKSFLGLTFQPTKICSPKEWATGAPLWHMWTCHRVCEGCWDGPGEEMDREEATMELFCFGWGVWKSAIKLAYMIMLIFLKEVYYCEGWGRREHLKRDLH